MSWARRHTVDVLRCWGFPSDPVETARLLVSELTTNAIRHTQPDVEPSSHSSLSHARAITLTLRADSRRLLLLVEDDDRRAPVVKRVGTDSEGGRGLFLVTMMSQDWGFYFPVPRPGKVVWAQLALQESDGTLPATPVDLPSAHRDHEQVPPVFMARARAGLWEL
nr:ATP-binding protein [Streptomyces albus]